MLCERERRWLLDQLILARLDTVREPQSTRLRNELAHAMTVADIACDNATSEDPGDIETLAACRQTLSGARYRAQCYLDDREVRRQGTQLAS